MAERPSNDIAAAVSILTAGGIVAFATETVYGLGADATSSTAVQKIFAAKGRPSNNPLIVHVADETIARRYALVWPDQARQLAAAFWPGPLTLVVPKTDQIVPEVTAGRNTVALRVPNHPLALELLRAFDGPVAAPSANRSGHVSPTTAEHVQLELGNRADLILDGGPCQVGIESTVLDLSGSAPIILRPGGVSRRQIEELIGPVSLFAGAMSNEPAASPGMQAVHYSPKSPMFRFEPSQIEQVIEWCRSNIQQTASILLLPGQWIPAPLPPGQTIVLMPNDPAQYAKSLYATLHNADARAVAIIWVQMPPDNPDWAAVRDRLIRASKPL